MLLQAKNAQLVLLDFQSKNLQALADGSQLLATAKRLTGIAKLLAVPIISTQLPETLSGAFAAELTQPAPRHVQRTHYSAASENGASILPLLEVVDSPKGNARSLPKHLQKPQAEPRSEIVLGGLQTHGAVLQTALDLLEQEWEVCIVVDACAARHTRDHDAALDRLAGQGAELVTVEMLALEWLADTEHKHAAQILALLDS